MLVFFALALVVLLGFCGLAVDVGMLELKQLQLQNAADAAAFAAISVLSGGSSAWTSAADADAAVNGFTDGVNGVSVLPPVHPTTGVYANNNLALQVTLTQSVTPIFFPGAKSISAQATALAAASPCVYLLLTSPASGNYNLDDLNSPTIQTSCDIYLNANYRFRGNSVSGAHVYVAGPPSNSVNTPAPSPSAVFNSAVQMDPLISKPAPTPGTCTGSTTNVVVNNANATLFPATYCGGIIVNSNAHVTFSPGIYIVNGNVTVSGNSVVTGNGVCFYLTRDANSTYGSFTINASQFNLYAPRTGPLQGILVFTDRQMAPEGGQRIVFNAANVNSTLDGILYAPGQQIVSASTPLQSSPGGYFGLVADSFVFNNTGVTLTSNYSSLQNGNPFTPAGGALSQ